jgi:predicted methyltransferase
MNLRFARVMLSCWVLSLLVSCASQSTRPDLATAAALQQILASNHRSAASKVRDLYRHPKETLLFFGIRRDMTVVEVWPGSGWYTELLAPLLRDKGHLYTAQMDPAAGDYVRATVDSYRAMLSTRPDLYGKVTMTALGAPVAGVKAQPIAPAGSADLVVSFRNLHNWMMQGWEPQAITAMHDALKPGGVLGIVDHRGNPEVPQDPKAASGYVNEQYAIEMIEKAGFKLVARSQINANPRDIKSYEQGVWTLPPTYALGDKDRQRYASIGESDRFTLKFIKVAR